MQRTLGASSRRVSMRYCLKLMAVEAVERAAGLNLFNDQLKSKSKQLCAVTQCQLVVRRFDDARKQVKK